MDQVNIEFNIKKSYVMLHQKFPRFVTITNLLKQIIPSSLNFLFFLKSSLNQLSFTQEKCKRDKQNSWYFPMSVKSILVQLQINLFFVGMIALLVVTAMGCGMRNLCRRRSSDDEETSSLGYSVAVSNSMFREDRYNGYIPGF